VVGGGPVGIELGQAFQRLGSKVHVVSRGERVLEKELPEISALLLQRLEDEGMQFHFNAQCIAFPEANKANIERTNRKNLTLILIRCSSLPGANWIMKVLPWRKRVSKRKMAKKSSTIICKLPIPGCMYPVMQPVN